MSNIISDQITVLGNGPMVISAKGPRDDGSLHSDMSSLSSSCRLAPENDNADIDEAPSQIYIVETLSAAPPQAADSPPLEQQQHREHQEQHSEHSTDNSQYNSCRRGPAFTAIAAQVQVPPPVELPMKSSLHPGLAPRHDTNGVGATATNNDYIDPNKGLHNTNNHRLQPNSVSPAHHPPVSSGSGRSIDASQSSNSRRSGSLSPDISSANGDNLQNFEPNHDDEPHHHNGQLYQPSLPIMGHTPSVSYNNNSRTDINGLLTLDMRSYRKLEDAIVTVKLFLENVRHDAALEAHRRLAIGGGVGLYVNIITGGDGSNSPGTTFCTILEQIFSNQMINFRVSEDGRSLQVDALSGADISLTPHQSPSHNNTSAQGNLPLDPRAHIRNVVCSGTPGHLADHGGPALLTDQVGSRGEADHPLNRGDIPNGYQPSSFSHCFRGANQNPMPSISSSIPSSHNSSAIPSHSLPHPRNQTYTQDYGAARPYNPLESNADTLHLANRQQCTSLPQDYSLPVSPEEAAFRAVILAQAQARQSSVPYMHDGFIPRDHARAPDSNCNNDDSNAPHFQPLPSQLRDNVSFVPPIQDVPTFTRRTFNPGLFMGNSAPPSTAAGISTAIDITPAVSKRHNSRHQVGRRRSADNLVQYPLMRQAISASQASHVAHTKRQVAEEIQFRQALELASNATTFEHHQEQEQQNAINNEEKDLIKMASRLSILDEQQRQEEREEIEREEFATVLELSKVEQKDEQKCMESEEELITEVIIKSRMEEEEHMQNEEEVLQRALVQSLENDGAQVGSEQIENEEQVLQRILAKSLEEEVAQKVGEEYLLKEAIRKSLTDTPGISDGEDEKDVLDQVLRMSLEKMDDVDKEEEEQLRKAMEQSIMESSCY